jgi:hypothetical protein
MRFSSPMSSSLWIKGVRIESAGKSNENGSTKP